MIQYLIDMSVHNGTYLEELHYSSGLGTVYGGYYYEPRITNPLSLKMMMFADGTTHGKSVMGFGAIELANIDGDLDFLIDYNIEGRQVIIKELLEDDTIGLAMLCIMEQPVWSIGSMSLRIKDYQLIFNTPLQVNKYGGTNVLPYGLDGTADIKGKPKPIAYGVVNNATPVLVNTSKLVYQCNDAVKSALNMMPLDGGISIGEFTSSTGWAGAGGGSGSISGGKANFVNGYVGLSELRTTATILNSGDLYEVAYEITDYTSGELRVSVAGEYGQLRSALGVYTERILCPTNGVLSFISPLADFNGSIDHVKVNAVPTTDITNVYDKGILLTRGDNYSSEANMMYQAPLPGTFRVYKDGYFRLGSAPVGSITCDIVSGGNVSFHYPDSIVDLILARCTPNVVIDYGLAFGNYSPIGFYADKEMTISAALDEVANSVFGWYGFDLFGTFIRGRLDVPVGNATITYDKYSILSLDRLATQDEGRGVPVWKVNLNYNENQTIQDVNSLAGALSSSSKWVSTTIPATAAWCSIAFGNGVFVATAALSSDKVAVSVDGSTWALSPNVLPSAGQWSGLKFGNGVFIAVRWSSNQIAVSLDGKIWFQPNNLPLSTTWWDIAYGDGKFMVVSGTGYTTVTSDNGVTWSTPVLTAGYWFSVAYGAGVWVITNISGTVSKYSTDNGATWTASTLPVNTNWNAMTYGNGLFVLVGDGAVALTSPDGITWTQRILPDANVSWGSVTYGDGWFMAVAIGSAVSAISNDGITWKQMALESVADWWDVAYGNGAFVSPVYNSNQAACFRVTLSNIWLNYITKQYRTISAMDPTVKENMIKPNELNLVSTLTVEADAQAEAERQLSFRKTRRDYIIITLPRNNGEGVPAIGKEVLIKYPRFGYNTGKYFICIGYEIELATNSITLYLWG